MDCIWPQWQQLHANRSKKLFESFPAKGFGRWFGIVCGWFSAIVEAWKSFGWVEKDGIFFAIEDE